jgi:hypothetical protein
VSSPHWQDSRQRPFCLDTPNEHNLSLQPKKNLHLQCQYHAKPRHVLTRVPFPTRLWYVMVLMKLPANFQGVYARLILRRHQGVSRRAGLSVPFRSFFFWLGNRDSAVVLQLVHSSRKLRPRKGAPTRGSCNHRQYTRRPHITPRPNPSRHTRMPVLTTCQPTGALQSLARIFVLTDMLCITNADPQKKKTCIICPPYHPATVITFVHPSYSWQPSPHLKGERFLSHHIISTSPLTSPQKYSGLGDC